jgi:hypothetical protein
MAIDKRTTVTIIVALLGFAGSVIAAFITSGRTFDARFSEVQKQTDSVSADLKKANDGATKLAGQINDLQQIVHQRQGDVTRCAPRIYHITPESALNLPATGGGGAQFADYPELKLNFNLPERHVVLLSFQLTDAVLPVPGVYILARLNVDGEALAGTQSITPETDRYRTANATWYGTLPAGSHTVKVQYRSPATSRNHPLEADTDTRALYVVDLGC